MPVTRTAARALTRSKRKRIINLRRWSSLRKAIKSFKASPTDVLFAQAASTIDRSTKYGLFHANKASRMKSQLSRMLVTS